MHRPLTVDLTDADYDRLTRYAAGRNVTPEAVAGEWLAERARQLDDPLLRLAGFIDAPLTDVSERHDDYLGQALADDTRGHPGD